MPQNRKNKGMQVAFEKVLERYEKGVGSRYICYNLEGLEYARRITFKQCTDCKRVIKDQLEGNSSLENWIISKGYATYRQMWDSNSSYTEMKQTRINWLKHLISQCKKNKF